MCWDPFIEFSLKLAMMKSLLLGSLVFLVGRSFGVDLLGCSRLL